MNNLKNELSEKRDEVRNRRSGSSITKLRHVPKPGDQGCGAFAKVKGFGIYPNQPTRYIIPILPAVLKPCNRKSLKMNAQPTADENTHRGPRRPLFECAHEAPGKCML